MTSQEWRMWFIAERLRLHNMLAECVEASDDLDQKATALCEHDMALHRLARHAQKRIARADLVSVLAHRGAHEQL